MQFNQPDDDEGEAIEFRVAAWIPITLCIPVERLFDSYLWAMQNRRSDFPLSAPELVKAWRGLQDQNENQSIANSRGHKLLPEYAPGACQRCFGSGNEEMPDGTVRPDCQHLPLTKDEIAERAQAKAKVIALMREANLKIGAPKPVEVKKEEPKGVGLKCSACGRKVNTLAGWQVGEICKALIESIPCDGQMVLR